MLLGSLEALGCYLTAASICIFPFFLLGLYVQAARGREADKRIAADFYHPDNKAQRIAAGR